MKNENQNRLKEVLNFILDGLKTKKLSKI